MDFQYQLPKDEDSKMNMGLEQKEPQPKYGFTTDSLFEQKLGDLNAISKAMATKESNKKVLLSF